VKKVVCFLQNAWSKKYVGRRWQRDNWLNALGKSRSGQRLRQVTNIITGVDIWFDNTTTLVGDHPDSKFPPDLRHMAKVIREQQPDMVLCMGQKAREAWRQLARGAAYANIPVLFAPHPAYRVLTDNLLWQIAYKLEDGFEGEVEMIQEKPVRGTP
jgi:hypothetical protein